jgi:hypothetical protein
MLRELIKHIDKKLQATQEMVDHLNANGYTVFINPEILILKARYEMCLYRIHVLNYGGVSV